MQKTGGAAARPEERQVMVLEGLNALFAEALGPPVRVSVFGLFTLSQSVLVCFGITIVLTILAILLTRNLQRLPGRVQTVVESAVGFCNKFCTQNLGRHGKTLAPWIGTLALFIAFANLSGLVGVVPPTKELTVTASLALLSVGFVYGNQFRVRGLRGGLKHFAHPSPVMLPMNLLEILIRPLSLCMRLFGNILAAHIVMDMIRHFVPVFVPAFFSIYFDIFDGLIQMVVFVFLTTLFAKEAICDEDDDNEAPEGAVSSDNLRRNLS